MDDIFTTMSPMNGDYIGSDGEIHNLLELGTAPPESPKNYMTPMNGNFYASDGSVHNIDELTGGDVTIDDIQTLIIEHNLDSNAHAIKFTDYLTEEETNLLIQEHIVSLLIDKGSVPSRTKLPATADNYDSYLIDEENIIVFAYNKQSGLEWLPLNFFADMSLYETVTGSTEKMNAAVATSNNYTDIGLSNKRDIVTTANRIYSTNASGQQTTMSFAAQNTTNGSIAVRTATGQIKAIAAVADNEVVNLEQMNAAIQQANSYTDEQVAMCAPNTLASTTSNGLMSAADKTRLSVYTITDFNAFNPTTLGIGANGYSRPVYSGGDALNRPFAGSYATVGTITQESSSRFVLIVKVSSNAAEYTAYTRQYSSGTWLAWQPVPNASRINALEARIAALEAAEIFMRQMTPMNGN